jgi:hypothetical protein
VYCFLNVVSVAQLVEHRSVAPRVVGSNPIAHPKPPETKTFTLPNQQFEAESAIAPLTSIPRLAETSG